MDLLNFDNDCCFSLIGAIIIMHYFAGAVSISFCVVVKIPKVASSGNATIIMQYLLTIVLECAVQYI